MIDVSDLRIFVCTTPTNMTYSFDSLMGRAQEIFDQDPTSGHLFLFFNRCRDKLRRRRLRQALSLDRLRGRASAHDPSELVARRQQRQSLWALVERLDDKYRLPVILHYYEGLPCDEVASILNLRTSTIYSRLNTARIRLRAMLQDQSDSKGKEVNRKACARGSVEKET